MMSSVFSEEDRLRGRSTGKTLGRSAQGSVGSLATTVSPGTDAIKEEIMGEGDTDSVGREEGRIGERDELDNRRRSGSGSGNAINLSNLSIRQQEEEGPKRADENGPVEEGGGRIRRASAVSSNSVAVSASSGEQRDGEQGEETSRGGKRKAARMGSFHAETANSTSTPTTSTTPAHPTSQPESPSSKGPVVQPNISSSSTNHVDIVSYPSNDLLRLLASLLEQIAQANDARNVRVAAAGAPSNPPTASPSMDATPSGSAPSSLPSTRRNSLLNKSEDENFTKGRFDAAPLNSPVTPHHSRRTTKIGGLGGPGILDNAFDQSPELSQAGQGEEMPLTPGVDLLREVGEGGGVEGFMPSLGGTHQPMPLSRRRGSSFIRNKRPDEVTTRPATSRQGTSSSSIKQYASAVSSSNESSPAPTRPSSTTPQGASPIPSPPNVSPDSTSKPSEPPLTSLFSASSVALSSPNATLCFHARNVPAISIEAYLLRILKYCPTTNEVFLALLVYFDRMARIGLEAQRLGLPRDGPTGGLDVEGEGANSASQASKLFAIDSFNVHRLVIAGVTVASKFFSDVFYTNSRYAKVCVRRPFMQLETRSSFRHFLRAFF
jgi:hypothetical protein